MQFNPAIDLVAPRPIHQAKNNKPLACVRQGLVARRHLCVCGGEMIRKANFNSASVASATAADNASQGNQGGRARGRHVANDHGFSRCEC